MQILEQDGYPYKFNATACQECEGACCIGESGYIWIDEQEIGKLANFLKISKKECKKRFLIKEKDKFTIKESKISYNNYRCIFFDLEKKSCQIYDYRPRQCRTFPFWKHFKNNIDEVKQECIGILI